MIEFKGVHKTYANGVIALKDINIRIEKGEFVFIVGASGAGKSTFLKLIMGEELPSAGKIKIGDYNLTEISKKKIPYLRRTMG
ncbi:MAG: ATP-binding cassette domain-containing protein, partial [Oscillospiraceae bacterium]|nr:ATP-binding cassette domain-containing protein [Oscillospiraceae bacterium]